MQIEKYLEVKIPTVSKHQGQTLAIIGQGYVGLPLAMAAVDAGWTVIGVDNFEAKVAQINSGSSPVEDISDSQLKAALLKGLYKATHDFSTVSQASVITICVPTPLDDKREPDLALLRSAAKGIAPFVSNETLVVSESTSYPGTLRNLGQLLVDVASSATSSETDTLRARLGEEVYSSWFGSMEPDVRSGNVLRLSVPVKFLKSWIQSHYADRVLACWQAEMPTLQRVDLTTSLAAEDRSLDHLLGIDQLLHGLTYLAIVAVLIWAASS